MMSAYKRRTCPLLQTCNDCEQRKNKFYCVHDGYPNLHLEAFIYHKIMLRIYSNDPHRGSPILFPHEHLTESKEHPTVVFIVDDFRHLPLLFLLSLDKLENPIGTKFTEISEKTLCSLMKCLFLTDWMKQHLTPLFTY